MRLSRLFQPVGGVRTVLLLGVLCLLAWVKVVRAWEPQATYPRQLRHRHVITFKSPHAAAEPMPVWHRDAG